MKTQPALTLRAATAADLARIEALLVENELPTDGVADALPAFIVAEIESTIVGVVGMEYRGQYGLLRSTAVSSKWRGYGIGRRLVERMVADARERRVDALFLLTTTAERYFPNFGFHVTTRDIVPEEIRATGEFEGACPASATVMHLDLTA